MQRVEFVPHYRCYSERCIGNRAGLHAKIAEPPPILCKDTNKPRAKANLFAFCRGEVSKKKLKIRKGGRNYECLLSKISGSVLSSAKMMRGEDRAEFVWVPFSPPCGAMVRKSTLFSLRASFGQPYPVLFKDGSIPIIARVCRADRITGRGPIMLF